MLILQQDQPSSHAVRISEQDSGTEKLIQTDRLLFFFQLLFFLCEWMIIIIVHIWLSNIHVHNNISAALPLFFFVSQVYKKEFVLSIFHYSRSVNVMILKMVKLFWGLTNFIIFHLLYLFYHFKHVMKSLNLNYKVAALRISVTSGVFKKSATPLIWVTNSTMVYYWIYIYVNHISMVKLYIWIV